MGRADELGKKVCVGWLLACLTSQQHASVSQGRICTDNFTCCHTEIEAADQTFHLTQSQYTDTGPTSPSADPITPGAWQGSHWSANVTSWGKRFVLVCWLVGCLTSHRLEITVPVGWALNTNN